MLLLYSSTDLVLIFTWPIVICDELDECYMHAEHAQSQLTSRHDVATANNTFAEQQFEVYSFFLGMSSLTNSFLGGRHRFRLIYMKIECINLIRDSEGRMGFGCEAMI